MVVQVTPGDASPRLHIEDTWDDYLRKKNKKFRYKLRKRRELLEPGRSARLHVEAKDVDLSRFAVPGSQRTADSPSFLASVSGDFEATAPGLASLRGEGQLTRLESRTNEGAFGLAAPAAWRLADGRLVQEPLRPAGPLGTLEASGEVVLVGTPGGSLTLAGPFDLRVVSPFVPDTTLAGPASVDLRAKWDASGSRLEGRPHRHAAPTYRRHAVLRQAQAIPGQRPARLDAADPL